MDTGINMIKRSCLTTLSVAILSVCLSSSASPQRSAKEMMDPLNRGLIHWWKFNGNCMDSMGDIDLNPIGPVEYVPAVNGTGIDFDGISTGIRLEPLKELQFERSFTISVWALLRTYPSGKLWSSIIFNGDDRSGYDPYTLQVNPSGKLAFQITGLQNNLSEIQSPMPLNKFVLITGTYDKKSGSQRLYMNGQQVGSKSEEFSLTPVVPLVEREHAGVGIGTNNGFPNSRYNFGWDGIINDLRIYNRALTSVEVQSLFKAATIK